MTRKSTAAFGMTLALLCAAAGATTSTAPRVAVYDATEIAFDSYTVIKRLGVDGWRSAFGIRGYPDEARARDALLAEAAQAGADGVINLYCLGETDRLFNKSGYYCYGNAIRLKNERRVSAADLPR